MWTRPWGQRQEERGLVLGSQELSGAGLVETRRKCQRKAKQNFLYNVHIDKPRCHTYAQDATNDYFNVAMNFSVNPLGSN